LSLEAKVTFKFDFHLRAILIIEEVERQLENPEKHLLDINICIKRLQVGRARIAFLVNRQSEKLTSY